MPRNAEINDDITPFMKLLDQAGNLERYEKRCEAMADLPPVEYLEVTLKVPVNVCPDIGGEIHELCQSLIRKRRIRHLRSKGFKF